MKSFSQFFERANKALQEPVFFIPSLEAEPTQADWVDVLAAKSLLERAIERNLKNLNQTS